jgi:hypothetical protein
MPCTLNKKAYEKLIDEDISWLDNQPDTLEAKHIRQILEWIKTHRQLDLTERITELEFEIKGMERDINVRDSDIEDLKRELSKS